jgi:hypothetical protein
LEKTIDSEDEEWDEEWDEFEYMKDISPAVKQNNFTHMKDILSSLPQSELEQMMTKLTQQEYIILKKILNQ